MFQVTLGCSQAKHAIPVCNIFGKRLKLIQAFCVKFSGWNYMADVDSCEVTGHMFQRTCIIHAVFHDR